MEASDEDSQEGTESEDEEADWDAASSGGRPDRDTNGKSFIDDDSE